MNVSKPLMIKKILLVTLLIISSNSYAQEAVNAREVRVIGNQRIDTAAILAQLPRKSGNFTQEEINKGVKAIYQTGFFDQVNATIVSGNILQFNVAEKPLVRKIYVEGNEEVDTDDLLPVLKLGANRFLDRYRVDTLRKSGVTYYQQKGFYDAELAASVVPVGDNQVDITFRVTEGKRLKLSSIEFRGLSALDEGDFKDAMQTKEYAWWKSWLTGSGRLNKELLEADQGAIRQVLLDKGYVDGSVSDGVIERRGDDLALVFDVVEGDQFHIGNVKVSGDLIDGDQSKTLEGIKLTSGEVFNATKLREDSFTITDKFADQGYAFANVIPNTGVNPAEKKVNLEYIVTKGKPVTVDRIQITGNKKTYDNVIRREMEIQEQEQFSSSKVKRSRELLQRLGYFNQVNVTPETIPGKEDSVNLNVNVQEGQTGQFSAGAGYSSADGVLFNARITENNIFGTGKSVDLNADIGTETNNYSLSYRDRRFQDTYLSLGVEGYRTERKYDDFDRELTGAGFIAGYPLDRMLGESLQDISASLRYDIANVDIVSVDPEAAPLIQDSKGAATSSSITPALTRNTINNPLNPTEGSQQVLSYEYGGVGGDLDYNLFSAKNTVYHPIVSLGSGTLVFSNRTRFDYGVAPDKYGEGPDFYPLFKRFFPGGINTIRGYESRSMGPKVGDSEYGGNKQFINNTELIFPLVESAGIRGVVFFDIGDAFDDNQSLDFGELRKAYGAGLRWQSPLGPIRIEFGFPMDKEEGDGDMQTMFTFGAPF